MKRYYSVTISAILLAILANPPQLWPQSAAERPNSCASCHLEIGDELAAPVLGMKEDVHAHNGLSCVNCHGGDDQAGLDGDMEAAMNPAKGYIGVPQRTKIPQLCAKCHSDPVFMRNYNPRAGTDQLALYKTSVHGKLLARGDEKVATCIDCHGVHGIREVSDPRAKVYALNIPETCGRCHEDPEYMSPYHIRTDQVAKYKTSVHGIALLEKGDQAAPACNDCHGNHGANPPNAPSIVYVCGQCHPNNSDLFMKSPHRAAFAALELPECETCHGNHAIQHPTDELVGTGKNSVCMTCHEQGSAGFLVAGALAARLDTLKLAIADADSVVDRARRAGMEVNKATFDLNDADDFLIKARTTVHSLSDEKLAEQTTQGLDLADGALSLGMAALAEVQFRRKGLAVSVVFILILAAGVYLKIKEVDRRTMTSAAEAE